MSNGEDKRKYRVFVNGQNYWLHIDGRLQKTGFYTTRFVEAQDAKEAEDIAVELVRNDSKLMVGLFNEQGDPPMLYAEEAEEVDALEPAHGYAFYSKEEDVH